MNTPQRHRGRARLAFLALSAVVIAACGSSDDGSTSQRGNRNSALPVGVTVKTYSSDAGQSYPVDIAIADDGSRYVFGNFQGTVDFDDTEGETLLSSPSTMNMFLAKHDSAGALLWVKGWDATSGTYGTDMVLDSAGNVVMIGSFNGSGDLDPGPGEDLVTTMVSNSFIMKISGSGDYLWSYLMQAPIPQAVDTTNDNFVVVAGMFSGSYDFDSGPGSFVLSSDMTISRRVAWDVFTMHLSAEGKFDRANRYGGPYHEYAYALSVDDEGTLFLGGAVGGSTSFSSSVSLTPSPSTMARTGFVARINADSEPVWIRGLGGAAYSMVRAIHLGTDGLIRVAGYATNQYSDSAAPEMTLSFYGATEPDDVNTTTLSGMSTAVLGFIDTDGVSQRIVTVGDVDNGTTAGSSSASAVTSDTAGNTYVSVQMSGSVAYSPVEGSTPDVTSTNTMPLVYKINSSGSVVWFSYLQGLDTELSGAEAPSMAVDADGNLAVYIYGAGPIEFNPRGTSLVFDAGVDSYSSYVVNIASGGPAIISSAAPTTTAPASAPAASAEPTISVTTPPLQFRISQPLTAMEVAGLIKFRFPAKSKLTLKVSSVSKKNCAVSRKLLTALKAGKCKVTVTATPRSGKGKAKSKTGTVVAYP